MKTEIKEQISAFVDGELSAEEADLLVRRLGADPALQAYAAKLMRISQAMRGERSHAGRQFAGGVMAALDGEPALDAEANTGSDESTAAADGAPARRSSSDGWLRYVAGGGIAAAVAVAVLLSLPALQQEPVDDRLVAPLIAADGPADNASRASIDYVVPETLTDSGLVAADPELAAYYLSHSVTAPSLAPGNGRVRMLTGGDADEVTQPPAEAARDEEAPDTARGGRADETGAPH